MCQLWIDRGNHLIDVWSVLTGCLLFSLCQFLIKIVYKHNTYLCFIGQYRNRLDFLSYFCDIDLDKLSYFYPQQYLILAPIIGF